MLNQCPDMGMHQFSEVLGQKVLYRLEKKRPIYEECGNIPSESVTCLEIEFKSLLQYALWSLTSMHELRQVN